MTDRTSNTILRIGLANFLIAGLLPAAPDAQDRLRGMPGYPQYQRITAETGPVRSGEVRGIVWAADGGSFEYTLHGKRYRFQVATKVATELGEAPADCRGHHGHEPLEAIQGKGLQSRP